jgi:hypothetical protein
MSFKSAREFSYQTLLGLAAVACILTFICEFWNIKAKDINMNVIHIGWPAWMWLVLGLVLFAISIATSVKSLRANVASRRISETRVVELEGQLENWKRKADAVVGECNEKLRKAREAFEVSTAEYVKSVNKDKNAAILELSQKHADEIAALKLDFEKHAAALVKQGVTSTRQEQPAGTLFPSLSSLNGQTPEIKFDAKEFFRTAYFSPVTAEMEQNVKMIAHQYDQDPEVFYSRFIGVGAVAVHHDLTWAIIYKSQIDLLSELNRVAKRVSISVAKKYYDEAAQNYPNIYPEHSFENWLGYIQSRYLLARYPSDTKDIPDTIEIANGGRDFLKFLAHWGKDVSTKKG